MQQPIRMCVDTNVLIMLALVSQANSPSEIIQNKIEQEDFEKLKWLDAMLKAERVELVIPRTVNKEIRYKPNASEQQQKGMSAQTLLKYIKQHKLKPLVNAYIEQTPGIKFAFVANTKMPQFKMLAYNLAENYSYKYYTKSPQFPKAAFVRKPDGNIKNDAIVMAEATLLGLDILTFDKHFLLTDDNVNIPQLILNVNNSAFKSSVQPLNPLDFIAQIQQNNSSNPYVNKKYKPKNPEKCLDYCLLGYHDYIKTILDITEKIKSKTETLNLSSLQNPQRFSEGLAPHYNNNIQVVFVDSKTLFMLAAEHFCRLREPKIYEMNKEIFENYSILNHEIENHRLILVSSQFSKELNKQDFKRIKKANFLLSRAEPNENHDQGKIIETQKRKLAFEHYLRQHGFSLYFKTHTILQPPDSGLDVLIEQLAEQYQFESNFKHDLKEDLGEILENGKVCKSKQSKFLNINLENLTPQGLAAYEKALAATLGMDIICTSPKQPLNEIQEHLQHLEQINYSTIGHAIRPLTIEEAVEKIKIQKPFLPSNSIFEQKIQRNLHDLIQPYKNHYKELLPKEVLQV